MKVHKSLDEEVSSLFSSETIGIEVTNLSKTRIKVLSQLLSSHNVLIEQPTINTLSNFIKNTTKTVKKNQKSLDLPLLSLVCSTISKTTCMLYQSNSKQIDKDSFKPLQNIVQNLINFESFLTENKFSHQGGVYLALNEIMIHLGSRIQTKFVTQIIEIAFNGFKSKDDTIGLMCGSLLSSSCLNQTNFSNISGRLLFTLQELLNLCYCAVKDETKKQNHLIQFIAKSDSLLVQGNQTLSEEEVCRLFKFVSFSISKLISNSYTFIIDLNVDSVIQLLISTLLLDTKTYKVGNFFINKIQVSKVTNSTFKESSHQESHSNVPQFNIFTFECFFDHF
jgi:hypothetical protein